MKMILPIFFGATSGYGAILTDPHLTNVGILAAMVIGIVGSFVVRPVEQL